MRTAALPKRSSHPLFVRAVCIIEKCTPANRQISTSFSNAGRDSFTWRCVESHNNQNDLNTPSLFDEAHRGSRKSSQESSGCSPLRSETSLCSVPIFRLMKGHGRRRARMRGRSLLPSRRLNAKNRVNRCVLGPTVSQSQSRPESRCTLSRPPPQRRITSPVMSHWAQHHRRHGSQPHSSPACRYHFTHKGVRARTLHPARLGGA